MTLKKQSREQLKLLKIEKIAVGELGSLKSTLLRKYKGVLFLPFFDNGEITGFAIPAEKKEMKINKNGLTERFIRDIAKKNRFKGKKVWIRIQSQGIATQVI